MARLSVSVMAHPQRSEYVPELIESLGSDVPIAWAANPEPTTDTEQRWDTGRRAWLAHDAEADWHMVIQDDALATPGLIDTLGKALDHVPGDGPVSPYLGTKRPVQKIFLALASMATQHRASWVCARSISWGVAIILPTDTIPGMVQWADRKPGLPYDTRVGRYYRDHLRQPTWYTWPSLVDHRQGPSLLGHGDADRRAHRYHEADALALSWTGPVVVDARVPARLGRVVDSDLVVRA